MPEIVDDEILKMHIQESMEHLETIESDLLEIEQGGEDIDDELVNKVFRAAHSIKGGSGFLGLDTIKELAHKTENVLDMIRKRQLVPTPEIVSVVLQAFDRLVELLDNVFESNEMDISEQVAALQGSINGNLGADEKVSIGAETTPVESAPSPPGAAEKVAKSEPVPPSPARQKKTPKKNARAKSADGSTETLRVQVSVLDQLMNRAGELVLARNQLLQSIAGNEKKAMVAASQRISLVTSELQEAIMLTRMQPVGNIFNKFTRVVRDLARDLGKEIEITLEGKEVELDKTIIEGLGDPMTHLVRNSCDHGIELPAVRQDKGKPSKGSIWLRAFHESGQVIIEIEDDGKGLDCEKLAKKAISNGLITEEQAAAMSDKEKNGLIMLPGFSMAEQVTEVSGRGVGMDVVKTNLDQLGGEVELISEIDKGSIVRIKLPLTLAIIPSLLVSSCDERFALPQVNVGELLRITAAELHEKIEKVGGADVLILRGELIPLLQLNNVLELSSTYYDPNTSEFREDRRNSVADERLVEDGAEESRASENVTNSRDIEERRGQRSSDVSVVVLQTGAFRFGLVVEEVHETVEIVVKPLGRHLKKNEVYAGATIMGDGNVALILDVAGLAKKAELSSLEDKAKAVYKKRDKEQDGATRQTLLLFQNGQDEYCAVPLHQVLRVEQIKTAAIEVKGGKKVIQYRGGSLPVYALEEVANVNVLEERDELTVIIFVVSGREVGLLATPPLDVIEGDLVLDEYTLKQPGIGGSAIIRGETTLMVDIFGFIQVLNPDWFEERTASPAPSAGRAASPGGNTSIMLAEDSMFFRAQVKQFIESEGYTVVDFADGQLAWEYLKTDSGDIGLVVTDLEMPNMDGFELTRNIKGDERFSHLKVIALTSLAGEEDVAKGKKAGIDEYYIKLDKEKLLQGIHKYLRV